MQVYAKKEGLMSQRWRRLISSFEVKTTPLLIIYLGLGFECMKISRFAKYTPVKYFHNFEQSAVKDQNPNSRVVAEAMKWLVSSSHGYKIMDRSRHSATNYSNEEKTHAPINNKRLRIWGISTINITR